MTFSRNETPQLWQNFGPRRKEIKAIVENELYSVEQYPSTDIFTNYDPDTEFVKWAAMRCSAEITIPEGLEELIIPEGEYAVFNYKGLAADAEAVYRYIYLGWIPNSEYEFDHRPHFALMGSKYRRNDPASEEEFWIPVRQAG